MEIFQAYNLTGSFRDAAELAGCSHHTVAAHVASRDAGGLSDRPAPRLQLINEYLPKVEEWVEQSAGKIRADKAHDKLLALGYVGSERLGSPTTQPRSMCCWPKRAPGPFRRFVPDLSTAKWAASLARHARNTGQRLGDLGAEAGRIMLSPSAKALESTAARSQRCSPGYGQVTWCGTTGSTTICSASGPRRSTSRSGTPTRPG